MRLVIGRNYQEEAFVISLKSPQTLMTIAARNNFLTKARAEIEKLGQLASSLNDPALQRSAEIELALVSAHN